MTATPQPATPEHLRWILAAKGRPGDPGSAVGVRFADG